jgi:hypothetical protein
MKPETKALLKAARAERGGPTPEARSRMRGKVLAAVGATAVASSTAAGSAVAGTTGAAGVGGAGVATAGAASGVSWAIGTGVVVVALGGGYVLREASREAPSLDDAARTEATAAVTSSSENAASPRNAVAASPEAAGSASHGRSTEGAPLSEPPAAAAVPAAPRSSSARPAASASESTPPSHASDAATVSADALAEESALLATARSSLASGDPKAALRALGDHATRFPRGVLSSERRALTAMALCADGRAAEGLATFPLPDEASDTPLSRRVRSACAR